MAQFSVHEEAIVRACMALRADSPEGWEALVKSMEGYRSAYTEALLMADQSVLQNAQGMARMLNQVAVLFRTAPERYERIIHPERKKP